MNEHDPQTPRLKPLPLQPGDTVGIVAPASNIRRDHLDAGCERLRDLGYKPFYFESILEQELYFAGSVERRAREMEEMFTRDEVRAIVCARGGYGANYLLGVLDLMKIERHPKIFVGYSDITTLLTYFADTAGFVTFHGPMVAKDFSLADGVDVTSWNAALTGLCRMGPESWAGVERKAAARGIGGRDSLRRLSFDAGGFTGHAL